MCFCSVGRLFSFDGLCVFVLWAVFPFTRLEILISLENVWYNSEMLVYRDANIDDLKEVSSFTDFWLSGRGKRVNAPGAVDDYFISPSQHKRYVCKYRTFLCLDDDVLVGWSVIEPSGTMINLLVAGNRRGEGIGKAMMNLLKPKYVRSKSDQSSGDPRSFYEKMGYRVLEQVQSRSRFDIEKLRPNRKANVDVLICK